MASLYESDYRNSPFFVQQSPHYTETPHTPPPYYMLPGGGCNTAVPFAPYSAQNVFYNSLQHVQSEYDGFVDGVISDVLIRVGDGSAYSSPIEYTPPCEQKFVLPSQYPFPQGDNLMWGSDASFGPNGYRPNSPPEAQLDQELVYLYTKSIQPLSHRTPSRAPSPVPKPEPDTITLEKIEQPLQELAELGHGGLQKITGKKRRRLLHIIAERNRRLNQNKMYEELYRMVPGLENSSRSTKREVLTRTADFLEDLVEENKRLAEQLRQLPPRP
ncbi:hypothetical protein BJY04DRAFT_38976 [Aspergillus karnatakaensis]|uniref:uncharacterized protein n=1 Tax=Aspergillus karnatakaensis TaxID=1810916 RepID=UPI003CCD7120